WQRLAFLTDTFGSRLSGSPQLEATLRGGAGELKKDFDEERVDPVMVPHWVRGAESLEIIEPQHHDVVMLGLGDSIGTPSDGIQAELLVVQRFAELCEVTDPQHHDVVMLGLGNSRGTPSDGIQAELLVVKSFADLDANRDRA